MRNDGRVTTTKTRRAKPPGRRSIWYCYALLPIFVLLMTAVPLEAQRLISRSDAAFPFDAMHRIEIGDTLSLLAAYYYGDGREWPRILKANVGILKAPNWLTPGQNVWIPLPAGWTLQESYATWKTRLLAKGDSTDAGSTRRKALLFLLILSNSLRLR